MQHRLVQLEGTNLMASIYCSIVKIVHVDWASLGGSKPENQYKLYWTLWSTSSIYNKSTKDPFTDIKDDDFDAYMYIIIQQIMERVGSDKHA